MNAYIQVKNVTATFHETTALDHVSFDIQKGSIVAIIGPNGSGKTTLLKHIIGIETPQEGSVCIDGKSPKQMRHAIGYVPQKFDFDRSIPITVYEFMALDRCGTDKHGVNNIDRVLKEVGAMGVKNQKLGTLSGGQFQRVMIARSLLHQKEILIFDEPSTGIDMAGEETIYDLIVDINKKNNTTCIIVSHELNIVHKYAQQVLCLNKKKICYGVPETVITPETLTALFGHGAGLYHSH
ncbi:metal ABC transporter ATP-binding protein [Patescibacteria group bacterium]|nr:metal ABC transporter ATP-binding protein [Patescibacteria group bacterium]MBU1722142.1 metal ABC transporter ATP-binding protein [Patescibacteria group bacterium]MBU1901191.1 metal ABC transporter ATP-binding protein [Patescibacteria group bacterium]